MSKTALDHIASFDNLQKAWKGLYNGSRAKSRSTAGVDGISLNDFAVNPVANIQQISRRLKSGSYTFSKLRPHFIIKPNGKERVICVPTTEDRVVQAALLHYLSSRYTTRYSNSVSYGFLKGRGVQAAVKEAARIRNIKSWVFKTDIKAFFDNIDRSELKTKIKRVIRESSLHALLAQVVDCEIEASGRNEKDRLAKQGIRTGHGVRQGMALSPFFSNVVLESFDNELVKSGFAALRYADDLIFFGTTRLECEGMEAFARTALAKEGLEIPLSTEKNSKSEYFGPKDDAEFLGIGICRTSAGLYSLRILPSQIAAIRKTFLDLGNIDQLLARGLTLGFLGQHLTAKKSGYIQAYSHSDNIAELETALDEIQIKVLKKIYKDGLLIPLKDLSPSAYAFLGLA